MTTKYAPASTPRACEGPEPFVARHVTEIDQAPEQPWLIDELWFAGGVGILGGHPKLGKTFIAVELALAVAAGGAAFGRYRAPLGGPVLFYGPEDGLSALRRRFEALALARRHDLHELPIYLLDVARLCLDRPGDLERMRATVARLRPRLVVLDPFVRLVAKVDENSASDVSAVLGSLRAMQHDFDVAVLLVHHTRKSPAARPGQALRGSGDFAAWSDTNLYLSQRGQRLSLQVEHRHAPPPDPLALALVTEPAVHMALLDSSPPDPAAALDPLADDLLEQLSLASRPLPTVELRARLHRRKADIVRALEELRAAGHVERDGRGWYWPAPAEPTPLPDGVPCSRPQGSVRGNSRPRDQATERAIEVITTTATPKPTESPS